MCFRRWLDMFFFFKQKTAYEVRSMVWSADVCASHLTVLDDYSRDVIALRRCSTMRAEDVTDTLDMALAASGCDKAHVRHRPRLLSDNGPSYIADELADYIKIGRAHV